MSKRDRRDGYVDFRFELTDEDFRLLKLVAAADDRAMAALLRRLIRAEAARRGLARPRAPVLAAEGSAAR